MAPIVPTLFNKYAHEVDSFIDHLANPGNPLSHLAGDLTNNSFTVTKIAVKSQAFFKNTWKEGNRREQFEINYRYPQETTVSRGCFLLSLEPLDSQIDVTLTQLIKECSSMVGIDPLLYVMITSSNPKDVNDAVNQLIHEKFPSESFSEEELNTAIHEHLRTACEQHPGLFRYALLNQGNNPIAKIIIQESVLGTVEYLQKERDQLGKIKEILKNQLMECKNSSAEVIASHTDFLNGKQEVNRTSGLKNLEYTITLNNGEEERDLSFKIKL